MSRKSKQQLGDSSGEDDVNNGDVMNDDAFGFLSAVPSPPKKKKKMNLSDIQHRDGGRFKETSSKPSHRSLTGGQGTNVHSSTSPFVSFDGHGSQQVNLRQAVASASEKNVKKAKKGRPGSGGDGFNISNGTSSGARRSGASSNVQQIVNMGKNVQKCVKDGVSNFIGLFPGGKSSNKLALRSDLNDPSNTISKKSRANAKPRAETCSSDDEVETYTPPSPPPRKKKSGERASRGNDSATLAFTKANNGGKGQGRAANALDFADQAWFGQGAKKSGQRQASGDGHGVFAGLNSLYDQHHEDRQTGSQRNKNTFGGRRTYSSRGVQPTHNSNHGGVLGGMNATVYRSNPHSKPVQTAGFRSKKVVKKTTADEPIDLCSSSSEDSGSDGEESDLKVRRVLQKGSE